MDTVYGYTVWLHCMASLYGHTVWLHCMATLYGHTVWPHCMATVYGLTVWSHCMATLYGHTVWPHCMASLYDYTVWPHCMATLYGHTVWPHCMDTVVYAKMVLKWFFFLFQKIFFVNYQRSISHECFPGVSDWQWRSGVRFATDCHVPWSLSGVPTTTRGRSGNRAYFRRSSGCSECPRAGSVGSQSVRLFFFF